MKEGLFLSKTCIPDQVALLALYMPIVRERVEAWTKDVWNMHYIRKQKKRPHMVPGKPIVNYFDSDTALKPPVEDRKCLLNPKSELIQRLQRDVEEWDPNQYLPPLTLVWCQTEMEKIGLELVGTPFDPEDPLIDLVGDPEQPYRVVYEELRLRAHDYYDSGGILELCEKPIGAANWSPS
jgi:hypothetical protein